MFFGGANTYTGYYYKSYVVLNINIMYVGLLYEVLWFEVG